MKGRKGGEGPQVGVTPNLAPPPSTNGARVMMAAKRRKRGGRVAPAVADSGPKVEGKMAAKRLDKPQRARGGSVDSNIARQTAKANSQLTDMVSKRKPASGGVSGDAALKAIRDNMEVDGKKVHRKRGGAVKGEIGADTKPFTHAKTKTPTKGHATEANIT